MTALSMDVRLTPSELVVTRELSGESIILDLKSGLYFGLNGVGTRVWNLIVQGGSLREVEASLYGEFDASVGVIEQELLRFAAELCEHGLCGVAEAR